MNHNVTIGAVTTRIVSLINIHLMFPNGAIANKFQCRERKCTYLVVFGLAPHFKSLLLQTTNEQDGYDESLNHSTQTKQVDILICSCNSEAQVESRYYGSVFMGHATVADMVEHFHRGTEGLCPAKVVQLSMDRLNVKWKFYSWLQAEVEKDFRKEMLNVGSCGLRIVHRPFKDGTGASTWSIEKLLSSLYWLFKGTPARREDYTSATERDLFPMMFCKHRGFENVPVVDWVLRSGPGSSSTSRQWKLANCQIQRRRHLILWMNATKMCFCKQSCLSSWWFPNCSTHSSHCTRQTGQSSFLSGDLERLSHSLMEHFMKPDTLKEAKSPAHLIKPDVTDKKQHLDNKKINVGFTVTRSLKELMANKKFSKRQVMGFRMEAKDFLIKLTAKLFDKAPIKYSLVRNLACLDPRAGP